MNNVKNRWMDIALAFVEKHMKDVPMRTAEQMVMVTTLAAKFELIHKVGVDAGEHVECDGCDTCDVGDATFWVGDKVHCYTQRMQQIYRDEVYTVISIELTEDDDFLYTLQSDMYPSEQTLLVTEKGDEWFMKFAA